MVNFQTVKPYLLKVLPYIVILLVGVGVGWKLKPDVVRTEIKEQVVEKKVVDEQLVQQMVDQRVKDIAATMDKKVVTVVVTKKDGTKVEKTTTDVHTDTKTKETEAKTEQQVKTIEKVVTVDRIIEKKIEPVLPQWGVGVSVGFAPRFDNIVNSPVMVSVQAERRLVGPVFITAQIMAGSPVTNFTVTNVAGMIGAKVEF